MTELKRIPVTIDEEMLRALASGGEVKVKDPGRGAYVYIIMADMGFDRMNRAVTEGLTNGVWIDHEVEQ